MRSRTIALIGFVCLGSAIMRSYPADTTQARVAPSEDIHAAAPIQQTQVNTPPLIVVGEGGTSGNMFGIAARTLQSQEGGVVYSVHDGDGFVDAMTDFVQTHGPIQRMYYFGHGNEVGLYVNQEPGVNGGVYAQDPSLSTSYRAASIYSLPRTLFGTGASAIFYGCNIAKNADDTDSFAELFANHFGVRVRASAGPTEFSLSPTSRTPPPYIAAATTPPDVYMVPTLDAQGFDTLEPSPAGVGGYDDVHTSMVAHDAIAHLTDLGLSLGTAQSFMPYNSITYADAAAFCRIIRPQTECMETGAAPDEKMRNTAALALLLDAAGYSLQPTNTPYQAEIWFAQKNNLLTPHFTNKRWYTRAEMALLTQKVLHLRQSHSSQQPLSMR